jgi:death-on-curing protein
VTDFLTLDDLLDIASGVLPEVQVRDFGLLESACGRPKTTVFGDLAYPGLLDQAAALIHSLARNHPLVDGNKRLAWSAMKVFLLLNEVELAYSVDDAEEFVLQIARGELEVSGISSWLGAHIHTDGRERPVPEK